MIRRISAIMAALIAAVAIPVVTPGVAQAAPACNSFTTYSVPEGHLRVPSIGWASGVINCELGRGNFGDAVRVIQVGMRSCAGQNIADDRDFGPLTEGAVKAVQRSLGVSADGRYGPITRNAGFPLPVFPTFETWNPSQGICYVVTG
jgi:hypothetical protein